MATDVNITGHEMNVLYERSKEGLPESGTFVVRCGMEGVRAMARIDTVLIDAQRNNTINSEQYGELLRLGIPHEIVSAPPSYKPPVVKIQRK